MQRSITGLRIRERRRALGMRQNELAARAGISASYLNLIEREKRGIGGALLSRIGAALSLSAGELDGTAERALRETLTALAADPELAAPAERVDEMIARFPNWALAAARAYEALGDAKAEVEAMADRLAHDPALASAVHDMLTEIAALRSTAEILAEDGEEGGMDPAQRRRFERNVFEQSSRLAETGAALADYFERTTEARRRRTPATDVEEAIVEDRLQGKINVAAEVDGLALVRSGADIEDALRDALPGGGETLRGLGRSERLTTLARRYVAARAMGEIETLTPGELDAERAALMTRELSLRFADALIAPFANIAAFGIYFKWDVAALTRAWDGDATLVMRRIAVSGLLRSLHVEVDASGRVLARRGALDLAPRSPALDCPVWPVHRPAPRAGHHGIGATTLLTSEGARLVAVTAARPDGMAADMLLIDPASAYTTVYHPLTREDAAALPVGADCRICAHQGCAWRRERSVLEAAPEGRSGELGGEE